MMKFLMTIALTAVLTTGSFLAFPLGFSQARETENEISFLVAEQDKAGFFNVAIGKDAPVLDFVIDKNNISIYNSAPPQELVQQIPYDPKNCPELDEGDFMELIDMNFDGYLDVKVMLSRGNVNVFYNCWLWNQDKKNFVLNEDVLSLPTFDFETKTITSFIHNSATDNSEIVYTFQDNKLKPVKITEQTYDWDKKIFIVKVYELDEKGVMQLILKKTLTEEEMEAEK